MTSFIDDRALHTLCCQGKLFELLGECDRLMDEARTRFGELHEETAHATAWLSDAHYELANFEKAAELRFECVAHARRLYGAESKEVVRALHMACLPQLAMERTTEAESFIRDALQLFAKLSPQDRFESWDPAFVMGAICVEKGEWREAERLFLRCLHHRLRSLEHYFKGSFNWTDYTLGSIFGWLSRVYQGQGKLCASERALRKSLRLLRSNRVVSRIHEARALQRLGAIQAAQGQRIDAIASLNEAKRVMANLLPGYQHTYDSIHKQLQALEYSPVA